MHRPVGAWMVGLFTSLEDAHMEIQDKTKQIAERQQVQTLLYAIIPYLPQPVVEKQLADPQVGQVRGEYWEGTVLFADLSGFTALSETLSVLGVRGAEEITRIVNDLFEALLEDVERYGGILVKFGGDALTVFFGGDEHALRAALTGLALQATMGRRFVNLDTLGGVFTLRLRVGVHSGRVFAAQVGYEPGYSLRGMELVVSGTDINRVAQAQDFAAPGDVCITAEVLSHIADQIRVEPMPGEMYKLQSFSQTPSVQPLSSIYEKVSLEDRSLQELHLLLEALGPYLPVDFTDDRNTDPSDPELRPGLRPVAVLFANFADLSAILSVLAPFGKDGVHIATTILNVYYARMQDVIGRYGGVINKVDMYTHGDKLMALFGAPRAHGDDVERAVRAALEMQAVMPEVNQYVQDLLELVGLPFTGLTQRIGINFGHVFAGNVGSGRKGSRREYTVMGDAVNLAARLMSAAEEGDVLISPSVRRQIVDRFALVDLAPMRVKGKTDAIPISRPRRPLTARERAALRRGRRPFIGRVAQLEVMQTAVQHTVEGQGQVVVVLGEVGTGKSRLIETFQDAVLTLPYAVNPVCFVTELPSYAQEPYAPIIDLLRRLIGLGGVPTEDVSRLEAWIQERVPDLGLFSPLLGALLATPIADNAVTSALTREQRRDRLFDLVERSLHAEARRRPLTLVVDDLQWADNASLALLDRLTQGVESASLLLILCYRPEVSFPTPWTELPWTNIVNVAEFTPEESGQFVAELLQAEKVPQALAEMVWERAQGNPFFTEEFVKSLRETEAIVQSEGMWMSVSADAISAAIPDTIEGIVLARLDRLEARCREVLQEASVAATSQARIARPLLEHVDPYPVELPERLNTLVQDGLLETLETELEELEYHFRHTLTRDVAYDNLLYARRRELHRLIARGIEAVYGDRLDEHVTTLAHHYGEAEDWPRAFTFRRRAGERAQLLFANSDAVANFRAALDLAEQHLPDMLAAMNSEELGEALTDVYEHLGDVLELEGRYEDALGQYALARTMVEVAEPSTEQVRHMADLCRKSAVVHERRSEYDAAFEWLEQGLGYLHEDEPTIEASRIYLLGAGVYQRQGKNEEAITWCQKSLTVSSQIKTRPSQQAMARAYFNLGGIHRRQGDLESAIQFCRESVRVYQQVVDVVEQSSAHGNLANAYFERGEQGDWLRAIDHYLQALEIKRKIGDVYGQAVIALNLGGVYRNQGDLDRASEYDQQSLEMWTKLGSTYAIALLYNNMGMTALRKGEPEEALAHVEKSDELFQQIGSEDWMSEVHRHLAEAYLGCGELDEAMNCAMSSLTRSQAQDMRLEEGMTRRVLGQIYLARQEPVHAEYELQESLRILDELNSRYEVGRTLFQLALLYREKGQRSEIEEALARAFVIFQDLGARLDLAEAQAFQESLDVGRQEF